jgi:tRNA/rRNA methyltransferase
MPFDPSSIRIVLVEPRNPENIGAAARAMRNCGLTRLTLVRPVDPASPGARRPAMEAAGILDAAEIFEDLDAALASARLVVGTTRRGGRYRRQLLTPELLAREVLPRAGGQEVAILFGTEKDGLTRREVDRCDHLVTIPAHPALPSFNLAQAVLLVAYEIFRASGEAPAGPAPLRLATSASREGLHGHLERVLLRIGFLHPSNPGRILSALRRVFGRAELEERDVRILRGILSQVEWALDRAAPPTGGEPPDTPGTGPPPRGPAVS